MIKEKDLLIKEEDVIELFKAMFDLSNVMPEITKMEFLHLNKYISSLYFEAFSSIKGFCFLLTKTLISQSCLLLRSAIESSSCIIILENERCLLDKYIEHYEFRYSIKDNSKKKQRQLIIDHYKNFLDLKHDKAFDYLDYGWAFEDGKKCCYNEFIKKANLNKGPHKLLPWIEQLNKWAHLSLQSANLKGPDEYGAILIIIAATVFDLLCKEFRKSTGFSFFIKDDDYYKRFRNVYTKIMKNVIIS